MHHVILIGLPKSGNVFIRESLRLILGLDFVQLCPPGRDPDEDAREVLGLIEAAPAE